MYDSQPESEYDETVHKAGALMRAIDEAEKTVRGGRSDDPSDR